jgi:hypothetical protein
VDSEFLNALPESLRRELVAANRAIARFNRAALEASGGADASAARDAMATATVPDASASAMTPDSPEIMDAVDPEFLAALPPDMQAEVVQQQTREVQRRARERVALADRRAAEAEAERARLNAAAPADPPGADAEARRAAAEAAAAACEAARRGALEAREAAAVVGVNVPPPASGAAAAAAPTPAQAQAELIASFPPEIRAEVLMTADAATLAALPPALQEEARDMGNLRGRNPETARHFLEGGFFARGGGGEGDPEDPRGVDRVAAAVGGDAAGRTFAEQLRSMLGLSGPGPSRGRGGGPGPFGLTAADRSALAAAPAEPAVDRAALFALLRLLRVSPPLSSKSSGSLPRVLLNVCAHAGTRDVVIRGLLATVRAATETAEAIYGGVDTASVAGCGELFGRDAHATCPTPEAAARWVAKRALETLTYLTRASHVFASRVALVAVRESDVVETVARAKAARANESEEGEKPAFATTSIESVVDRKGKRPREKARKEKGVESIQAEGAETELNVPDALEEGDPGAFSSAAAPLVLLRLLGSPAFESHAALGRARARVAAVRAHREQEGARAAGARLATKQRCLSGRGRGRQSQSGRQAARRAALGRARAVASGVRRGSRERRPRRRDQSGRRTCVEKKPRRGSLRTKRRRSSARRLASALVGGDSKSRALGAAVHDARARAPRRARRAHLWRADQGVRPGPRAERDGARSARAARGGVRRGGGGARRGRRRRARRGGGGGAPRKRARRDGDGDGDGCRRERARRDARRASGAGD